jgi:hypothetical protein
MLNRRIGKRLWISSGIFLVIVLIFGFIILNERITTWIHSDGFRDMLNRETSKGLKLHGQYSSLIRVGLLGMHADSFDGTNGYKTLVSLHTNEISGTFNPLGIALRRWELDSIHIKSGSVMLQKTEVKPGTDQSSSSMPIAFTLLM